MSDPVDGSTATSKPESARVLVVCNGGDAAEIVDALAAELPAGPIEVETGDGGDETLALFSARPPHVLVIAASLDAGDARSLIAAMREGATPGSFHAVLIGDARGPIRNALDAADFHVDRFVARPIAPKALRYAVSAGIAAIRAADVSSPARRAPTVARRPAMIGAAAGAPDPEERLARARVASEEGVPRGEVGEHEAATRPVSSLRLRWEALADAIELGDEGGDEVSPPPAPPVAPVVILPRRHTTRVEPPFDSHEDSLAQGERVASPPPALDEAEPETTVAPSPHALRASRSTAMPLNRRAPSASSSSVFDEETEPYGRSLPLPPGPPGPEDDSDRLGEGSGPIPAPLAPPLGLDELEDGLDDLDPLADDPALDPPDPAYDPWSEPLPAREPTLILSNPAAPVASLDEPTLERDPAVEPPPPLGGSFARELRKKMSEMAQRLFRSSEGAGQVPWPAAVDVAPPHDHHAEIDLSAIGEDPAAPGPAEPFELVASATYIGEEEPLAPGPAVAAWEVAARLTAEAGEIVRGHSDAAVLIARLSAQVFTGRLVMRRRGVEKVIYFDAGRPVFAASSIESDRMGQLLAREGKITPDQFHTCAVLSVATGRRMGEILVERGHLKRRELLPAVRRHLEDIIYSLFAWDSGDYTIAHGDGAADERIRLSKHAAPMVVEGVRRKFDLATLERLLGTSGTVVELADRERMGGVLSVSDLSADERVALAAMDGQNDLGEVARQSRVDIVNVYALAWGLLVLGLATARRRGEEDADTASQVVMGDSDLAIDRERVRARHALVADADYFALLGVRRDATGFEIKRAYEAALRDFAADTFTPELRSEMSSELDEIAHVLDEAFRVLHDDRLRHEYLANLMD